LRSETSGLQGLVTDLRGVRRRYRANFYHPFC